MILKHSVFNSHVRLFFLLTTVHFDVFILSSALITVYGAYLNMLGLWGPKTNPDKNFNSVRIKYKKKGLYN